MGDLINEIRERFASLEMGNARAIESLPADFPALVIYFSDGYGVALPVDEKMEIAERFSSCRFFTQPMSIGGESGNYLILSSAFKEFRHEFAALCTEFVDPGENGCLRAQILADPYKWWEHWKDLVGNASMEQRAYDVIGELLVLEKKLLEDKSTVWAATQIGSHDIECNDESVEVKSTLKRYGASVTISGQHQLEHIKRLYLYFCRLEESLEGVSINEMKERIINLGYDPGKLEIELQHRGFEHGANIRNKKYKLLEKRKYVVDDKFPQITKEKFKNDSYPDAIVQIQYTIDLDGISYTTW